MAERKNSRGYDPPQIVYTEETSLNGQRIDLSMGWEFSVRSKGEKHGRYRFVVQEVTKASARILLSYMEDDELISSKVWNIKYGRVFRIAEEDINKYIIERSPDGVSFNMEYPDTLRPSDPKPLTLAKQIK